MGGESNMADSPMQPPAKKSRTNTPWTPAEEQRLKNMRDTGNSWADIAKVRQCLKARVGGWGYTGLEAEKVTDISC